MDLACSFPTCLNPLGLASVNMSEERCVLAFPSETVGSSKIVFVANGKDTENKSQDIKCHNGALSAIRMSQGGDLLVTASDKGTLLRVWNTEDGN